MASPTQAIINLHALRDNYLLAKSLAPNSLVYANLMGNAYGHGLLAIANGLIAVVDGFMVSGLSDALILRQAGVLLPILVKQAPLSVQECQQFSDLDLEILLHKPVQLAWLQSITGTVNVWINVDTGAGQPGCLVQDVPAFVSQLRKLTQVSQIRLFSEFSAPQEVNTPLIERQQKALETLLAMKLPWSISDSATLLTRPQSHGQMVRAGLMLYGINPISGKASNQWPLQPVMTLQSTVVEVLTLRTGDHLYAGVTVQQDRKIAVIGMGYADGYPGSAKVGMPVLIRGKKWPIVGKVSMNTLLVDVTSSEIELGDSVTLWGTGLSILEVSEHCDTDCRELLCKTSMQVKFKYLGS